MKKYPFPAIVAFLVLHLTCQAQYEPDTSITPTWQPYYIHQRPGLQQMDLSGDWMLHHADQPVVDLQEVPKAGLRVQRPTSVQMAHFRAGRYPDPYAHLHSTQYEWMEEKVWYYRKTFSLKEDARKAYAYLCFDGLDYYSRIWLNGELLGRHEGMWGGPVLEVSEKLRFEAENELVVEVVSGNFGQKETFNWRQPGRIIKPRSFARGSSHRPFFALGMWRGVRLEFVDRIHMARPFLQTLRVSEKEATLSLQIEMMIDRHTLEFHLHPWHNRQISNYSNLREAPVDRRISGDLELMLRFRPIDGAAIELKFPVRSLRGRSWLEEQFTIPDPRLWQPNGLGEAHLYDVQMELVYEGRVVDRIRFDYGIRSLEWQRSAGPRTSDRWQDWQLIVNNRPIFVKGVNWMPADPLYDFSQEQYDWLIGAAKNAGIQMIRAWGGGALEIDEFYDACNRNGILVWQDFPLNNVDYPDWPQEVWEAQVVHNIFRLRNHPSLAVWCGGNEFNPYSLDNAATLYIMERNLRIFDPGRPWLPTSPDFGSTHLYPDFDPVWYKRTMSLVPFIAETGIHSITEPHSLYEIIDKKELQDLSGMYEETFRDAHPEFLHHFMEYYPSRVPRMLSRASHIDDMARPDIESISEATQISAGEFYQILSQGIQSNYPVTTGLLPWVFKRPWPVVSAIHLLDGFGQPSAPYYFLKRTYENVHVMTPIDRLLWKPGESVKINAKVLNLTNGTDLKNGVVEVRMLDDGFREISRAAKTIEIQPQPSITETKLTTFKLTSEYGNRFFFVITELKDSGGTLVSRSVYWPRFIPQMADEAFYDQYTSEPTPWPTLENGPWLKPAVSKTKTRLEAVLTKVTPEAGVTDLEVRVKNTGQVPAFPVRFEVDGAKRLFLMDDNFFWLEPGEERILKGKIKWREAVESKEVFIRVAAWNAEAVNLSLH